MIETAAKINSKPVIFNNFCQKPNEIEDLGITGTDEIPAAVFQTLGFILRLHPDTIITPKNISLQMEIRAIKNKGKFKKKETIRAEFNKLVKAGYMNRELNYDSKGGSMPTQYFLNYDKIFGGGDENSPGDKIDDNVAKVHDINSKKRGDENSTPPYNKVRASNNTNNTSKNTSCSCDSVNQKTLPPCRGDFLALVPNELRDKNIWKLINSVRKYFENDAYELMIKAFTDSDIKKPIDWLWGSVNKRRKKEPDNQDQQSLNKPPSTADIPVNPLEDPPQLKSEEELIEEENKMIEPLYTLSDNDFKDLMLKTKSKMSKFEFRRSNIDHYLRENCNRDLILDKAINRKRIIEVLNENRKNSATN